MKLQNCTLYRGDNLILDNVNLTIPKHTKTAVIGPNGSGKTSFMHLLFGLIKPSNGSVIIGNNTANRVAKTFMFQNPTVLQSRNLLDNIIYAIKTKKNCKTIAKEALNWIGMANLADTNATELSLGQQQKLCLARCWAQQAEILFLDEPTASLDPETTQVVEQAVIDMHKKGTKILISTHDMQQLKRVACDVVFIYKGVVRYFSNLDDFFADDKVKSVYML